MKTHILRFSLTLMLGMATASSDAETIGAPLVQRTQTDLVGGEVFALNNGFTVAGQLTDWAFFNNNPGQVGKIVTPLLFQKLGADYVLVGVGAARTNLGTGIQSFSFSLTAGSDSVAPGYLFGWKDGTDADAMQTGVIQFDFVGSPVAGTQQWFYTGNWAIGHSGNLVPGFNFSPGSALGSDVVPVQPNRDYSVQATVVVPEPSTLALGLVAVMMMAQSRRVRRGV
jgi:hypothetical protein